MDAIATGLPLIEQPVSSRKHPVKEEKSKGSFADLLQKSLEPSTAETTNLDIMPGDDKETIMKMLQNGNVEQDKQEEELTSSSTFGPLADADLLEKIKAMLTQIQTDEGDQDGVLIVLDQEQLQHVFNRLTKIGGQFDDQDDRAIEAIITAFSQGVEEAAETTDEKVREDDEWFDLLQAENEDISEQDVLDLLDGLLNKAVAAEVKPEQLLDLTKFMVVIDTNNPEQQQKTIAAQGQRIIDQVKSQKEADKAAKPLVKLLEAWSVLEKEQHHKQADTDSQGKTKSVTKQEQTVWQKLIQLYQKRNPVRSNKQNPADTKEMSEEVKKILLNARKDTGGDKRSINASQPLSAIPMSKVEQLVIHLQQQQQPNSQTVDQQLMDQFQEAMKTSKFFTGNNGTSQLHIALKPDNLGEMMVKLTQMNGEMTVKITVSAHATKDMLESNIYQLKHLFSPSQVVIEKQDVSAAEAQGFKEEQSDQPMQEQEQGGHSSQQENNQQDHQEEDNSIPFHEWLMNEKV